MVMSGRCPTTIVILYIKSMLPSISRAMIQQKITVDRDMEGLEEIYLDFTEEA